MWTSPGPSRWIVPKAKLSRHGVSRKQIRAFVLHPGGQKLLSCTLGIHWNTEVVNSAPLGVVSDGPFRWICHPNYLGVFVELIALPLIHMAWITAAFASAPTPWSHAIGCGSYRAAMSGKPRFFSEDLLMHYPNSRYRSPPRRLRKRDIQRRLRFVMNAI
jgi:isoprenylcysteine carboxyl methyltransferase (ICMT) family protein